VEHIALGECIMTESIDKVRDKLAKIIIRAFEGGTPVKLSGSDILALRDAIEVLGRESSVGKVLQRLSEMGVPESEIERVLSEFADGLQYWSETGPGDKEEVRKNASTFCCVPESQLDGG